LIVLGVDPGIANLGLSVHEVGGGVPPTLCYLKAEHTEASTPWVERLEHVVRHTVAIATRYHCQIAGIEEQDGAAWGNEQREGAMDANARKARDVSYALAGALMAIGVRVYLVRPQTARVAFLGRGGGNAPKGAIRERAERLARSLKAEIRWSEHACDSLASGAGAWVKHRELEARPKMLGGRA